MKKVAILLALLLFAAMQGAFAQTQLEITLEPDTFVSDNIVITALGIQRDKKTLPFSLQTISGEDMMKAQDINFMNALSGKIAGLEVKKAASGPGGSTRAILRGPKSFSGSSEPLYVIDGLPMVNRKGAQAGMWGGVDEGDGLSALNPDDIESITILKGANAAVLYGGQGANGVVLITTKKGKKGIEVSIGNSTTFEKPIFIPKMQYKYGSTGGQVESWATVPHNNPNGFTEKDVKDFFQKGNNIVTNVAISGGNNWITGYLSYANTTAKGIIPNNEYKKHNASLRLLTNFFNSRLTVGANIMISDEMAHNRPSNGYNVNPLTGLYFFPRERDISEYRDEKLGNDGYPIQGYRKFDKDRNLYVMDWFVNSEFQSNPWWVINMQPRWDGGKRIIPSANIDWNIVKGLSFKVRGTYDKANMKREQRHFAGSNNFPIGSWSYKEYKDKMWYIDAILLYDTYFGNFSLNALAGISYHETDYGKGVSVNSGTSSALLLPNIFTFQNLNPAVTVNTNAGSQTIKEGYFANGSVGFKEMIFLDLSGRNDRSAMLALPEKLSYSSHAIGFSGIISNMFSLPSFITFGKTRASYANVANDGVFETIFPNGSIANGAYPYFDTKPEKHKSIEIGTDWRFFAGRLGLDFTWYEVTSTDLFFNAPLRVGSVYLSRYINAGKIINKGVELTVNAEPVSTSSFSWKTAINYARNKNEIVEVNPSYDPNQWLSLGSSEGYHSRIAAGGSFGDLYVYKFDYDEQGRIKLNVWGQPQRTREIELVGSINPDFMIGWHNTFTYKRFSLGFLVNGIFGGKVISQTESMLDGYGVSKRSGDARDNGNVIKINGVDTHGSPVTEVNAYEWYARAVGNINGILANYVYDRTNVRLTQFSLNYNIPVKQLNLSLKSASVGLVGQNLLFLYIKAPYDPELTMSTGIDSQGLDNFNLPSTRTLGFNVRVNFKP